MFLKIQWKTPKPHALSPEALLKKISVQVYSCEDFKLLKNTFFIEHLRMTASDNKGCDHWSDEKEYI